MTREEATQWFWRTCPAHARAVIVMHGGSSNVLLGTGWVCVGPHNYDLGEFLRNCRDLTDETFAGSFDSDSDLTEYVRGAYLAAYGRTDVCAVRIVR